MRRPVFETIIKVQNNLRVNITKNPRNHGHMVEGLDSPVNRPFSKTAAGNSNKSKLKIYISPRKNIFT